MLASHLEYGTPWLPAVACAVADTDGQKEELVQIRQPRRRSTATSSRNPVTLLDSILHCEPIYGLHRVRPKVSEYRGLLLNNVFKIEILWEYLYILQTAQKSLRSASGLIGNYQGVAIFNFTLEVVDHFF
jgi:hypothetical protein